MDFSLFREASAFIIFRTLLQVDLVLKNLLDWPEDIDSQDCDVSDVVTFGGRQEGIQASLRELKMLLRSFVVRNPQAVLRSAAFKALRSDHQRQIMDMMQTQSSETKATGDDAAGSSRVFLVPSTELLQPSAVGKS